MANEGNLIPFDKRTEDERRRIARMGGKASGEARRAKKNTAQLTRAILLGKAPMDAVADLGDYIGGVSGEDLTVNAAMIAGQAKAAVEGNAKSFEILQEQLSKAESEERSVSDFTLSPLNFTSDFVEPYRRAREALDGKNGIREIISKGGRGSTKSSFWSAFAYETMRRDPQAHVVFTRRYKVDLRDSVYTQFEKTVRRMDDIDNWEFTISPMRATYKPTGQMVLFVGCDKPISLKSFGVKFGYVKLLIHEECDEMAGVEQMDSVEDTFLRSDTPALDIKIFNPPKSKNNFMNEYTAEKANDPATLVCHSYFNHVPEEWLGHRFFERAEWFRIHKPQYYANNYMGDVTGTGGELFDNVEERRITDAEVDAFSYVYQGLDFGFEHPMAFVRVAYDRETDTLYPFFEKYARHSKLSTFARDIDDYKHQETICDSANPDKISDLRDWDWEVVGATKRWKGGGRDTAWEWLRAVTKIVIDPERTPNLAKELRTLEFEQLRDGSFSSRYPDLDEDGVMATLYAMNRVIIDEKTMDDYRR